MAAQAVLYTMLWNLDSLKAMENLMDFKEFVTFIL